MIMGEAGKTPYALVPKTALGLGMKSYPLDKQKSYPLDKQKSHPKPVLSVAEWMTCVARNLK